MSDEPSAVSEQAPAAKTVLELIQATTAYFEKRGVESPRLNIEHLLAHTLGLRRMELYLQFDRPVPGEQVDRLRALVRRRAAGEPLQHLLGSVEFLGRTFACDRRALIPRPETEQLCELLLERAGPDFAGRLLDVGAGSGVIALTLASYWPQASVEAVDLSSEALVLARENAARLGISERVKIYRSDLMAETQGTFDMVVANLPYIAAGEISGLPAEVRHDPVQALEGGDHGHEIIQRLIAEASSSLLGLLALEIGRDQGYRVRAALEEHNYQDIREIADYQGNARFVFATHG